MMIFIICAKNVFFNGPGEMHLYCTINMLMILSLSWDDRAIPMIEENDQKFIMKELIK